ncbi:MAG: RHS repeat-associated core domain-containing protein, partial [Pyrinomonadaceae bacterium]
MTNLTFNASNNRITTSGYSFDVAGNTTADPSGKTFTYDAENKQTLVNGGSVGQYFYDGDGKRVRKYVPSTGETTVFVYDAGGKLVAEYSTIVYPASTAKLAYVTNDHLGSPRINTDANGLVTSRHDYHPFGEEILTSQRTSALGYSADTLRKQFTAYERDIEADLDFAQARYYNPKHGRFTSVDPLMASANVINPQTFNRYVYVGNNPVNITDPTGLGWGELDGTVRWFKDDAAMSAAGFGAYAAQVAWSQDGRTMFALNAATGAAVQVQNAAEVFRQIAMWGGSGAGAIGATAAALGVPIATGVALTAAYVSIMTSGNPIDAGGF